MPQNQPNPNKRYAVHTESRQLESFTVLGSGRMVMVRNDQTGVETRMYLPESGGYLFETPQKAWEEAKLLTVDLIEDLEMEISGLESELHWREETLSWVEEKLGAIKSINANPETTPDATESAKPE